MFVRVDGQRKRQMRRGAPAVYAQHRPNPPNLNEKDLGASPGEVLFDGKVMDHVGTYLYRGCPAVPTFRHESGGAPAADDLAAQHQHLITADLRGPLRTLLISQLTNGQV